MPIRLLPVALMLFAQTIAVAQSPTAFTYQGSLEFANAPYTGTADYRFTLFNSASAGVPIGDPVLALGVEVSEGLFTVPLDFGGETQGPGRVMQIEVRTPAWDGVGVEPAFFVFPDRTPVGAAPYSLSTRGLEVDASGRAASGGQPGLPQFSVFSGDNDLGLLVESSNPLRTSLHLSNTSTGGQFWSLNSNGLTGSLSIRGGSSLQSASTALTITPDRDIGIRTGIPTATLDVNGTMLVRDTMTVSGELEVQAFVTADGVISNGAITASDTILGGGAIFASGGVPTVGNLNGSGFAFSGNAGDRDSGLFGLGDGRVSLFTDAIERVRLDRRNIAIGAGITPQSNVHIYHQTAGTGWGIRIQTEAQGTFQTGMRVSNDGFFDITNHIAGGSGFARLTSSGVWTTISDERTKEDIHHLDNALDRAMRLDPVAYRYKGTEAEEIGFTAQNVAEQFPSLVAHGEDLMTLNYSGLSTVAIAALQELKAEKDAEIDELQINNARLHVTNAELHRLVRELAERVEALEGRSAP